MKQKFIIFLAASSLVLIGIFSLSSQQQKNNSSQSALTQRNKGLFSQFLKSTPTITPLITLVATGDVMLGRAINSKSVRENNFTWMWEKTAEILRAADLTFINLESPLVENCPPTNEGMTFCADIRNLEGLSASGIDIVNLGNNHISNYGQEGVKTTTELLIGAGINPVGIGVPLYKTLKGIRFAFLGYNTFGLLPDIAQEIIETKNNSDIVVVSFHWGNEYTGQPTARQRELAYLAIDSGADLVIGHHPHWIQPTEIYKDKLIVYSLGNFIFDQNWSEKTRQGLIGKFTFSGNKLINSEFLPIEINPSGQSSFKFLDNHQ